MVLRILKAIARPFWFVWDRIHNGQADMEAVYPESFHPTGEEAVRQGSVISGFIAGTDN
jgi:hypothetical protein